MIKISADFVEGGDPAVIWLRKWAWMSPSERTDFSLPRRSFGVSPSWDSTFDVVNRHRHRNGPGGWCPFAAPGFGSNLPPVSLRGSNTPQPGFITVYRLIPRNRLVLSCPSFLGCPMNAPSIKPVNKTGNPDRTNMYKVDGGNLVNVFWSHRCDHFPGM